MSTTKVPSSSTETVAARLAFARRAANLSQVELARVLGTSGWWVGEVEAGRLEPGGRVHAIAAATGFAESWLEGPARFPKTESTTSRDIPSLGVTGKWLVLTAIVTLVTVRFFTEIIAVAPRALNFVDIPVFLTLALGAMFVRPGQLGSTYLRVGYPAIAFFVLAIVSAAINSGRTEAAPVVVFIYGFLGPLAVYAAVYRIWPPGEAVSLSRMLVWLGLLQLAVVALVDLPRFATSGRNPDLISGTFGTNAYQLVFFLLVVAALLAGIFTFEPNRRVARFVPVLILAMFAVTLLAQYRALLATTVVTIFVVSILLGTHVRGMFVAALAVVAFGFAFSYVASSFPSLKLKATATTLTQDPWTFARDRSKAAGPVAGLYRDDAQAIVVGSGPGTFSSRAWQTFANAASPSFSNVQGGYAQKLTGGIYETDVSTKYVLPRLQHGTVIQGSHALSSPFSSYLSLAAEVGLLGLALIAGLYVAALLRSFRLAKQEIANATQGDAVPALTLATTIGLLTLLQMGFLENWLEVTRITFIVWAMFAVVTKELDSRSASVP
jgi:hypothetical protein